MMMRMRSDLVRTELDLLMT